VKNSAPFAGDLLSLQSRGLKAAFGSSVEKMFLAMSPVWLGILVVFGIFGSMLLLLEFGRRMGRRGRVIDPEGAKAGLGTVDGAVFGLMGLLIAFTFSGAAARFDARRTAAVDEANAIGTSWLRLDLLPAAAQASIRPKLRDYTSARLEAFRKLPDMEAARVESARANSLQQEIWRNAVAACSETNSIPTAVLVLPALNQMFDAASSRTIHAQMHPPLMIYQMLVLLVLASSLLAGYGLGVGKVRNRFHALAFTLTIMVTLLVILDFEFPRLGLIRLHTNDQIFVNQLENMKP